MTGPALRVLACMLALAGAAVIGVAGPRAAQAQAQAPRMATLVADRLYLDGPDRLVAQGNVAAFQGDTRLRASRIVYDRAAGTMAIDGPLVLTEGDRVVMLADAAELDAELRLGLVRSARVVLERQLQIAAASVERRTPRYTEMNNVTASTCEVCARSDTPLWEIRARRVVHDNEARQVHFEGAQLRLFGLPVAYIPRLRVPDPSLDRATGFLSPDFSLDSDHGLGLRAPYFIALGADRDLTVTPFLGSKGTTALALRYRQAFATGRLSLGGTVARDSIRPGSWRGVLRAAGDFAAPRGTRLHFDLLQPSDRSVLEDYGDAPPRLTSHVTLDRISRDTRLRARALAFRSLRPGDDNATLPNAVLQARYERRFAMPGLGGTGQVTLDAQAQARRAPLGPDPRRVTRASAALGWHRDGVLPAGVVGTLGAQAALDAFRLDPAASGFDRAVTRVRPSLFAGLRWPLLRTAAGGARHVVEPAAQVIWSDNSRPNLPNDASRMPELDEGNLFALDRFPGGDRREAGLRANLGLRWTRHDPDGWSSTLTLGRVVRARDLGQFSDASPLAGRRSDWLLAAGLDTAGGARLSGRALLDDDLTISRGTVELDWTTERYSLSTSYLRVIADPAEGRADTASEWRFEGSHALTPDWTAELGWRYDIARRRAAQAVAGLAFENECLRMQMQVERAYAATANDAETSFGLELEILGLGGNPSRKRRGCADG